MQSSDKSDLCKRGHNDWKVTDPVRGWRRCMTCRRLQNRRGPVKSVAWAQQQGRVTTDRFEDTFTRAELMKLRGYGE